MLEVVLRLTVLLGIGVTVWLLIRLGRWFIEAQRQQALAAAPLSASTLAGKKTGSGPEGEHSSIRILAFGSADCHQCHQMQEPALQRVVEARRDRVTVVAIDATTELELVQTYRVLTVPSTVILDTEGQVRALNYGFANTQRLLEQVDEVLSAC
ncbi:MAG: thioredoxin family protein [Ktedonobacteraceae bacterium]|nr:thioredoxin family protein [Ktedonobacteraceae bacterium]